MNTPYAINEYDKVVIVCVSAIHLCDGLLQAGRKFADAENATLEALNIQPPVTDSELDFNYIEKLHQNCKKYEANMAVCYSKNPAVAAAAYISRKNVSRIIVGASDENTTYFSTMLRVLLPNRPMTVVSYDDKMCIEFDTKHIGKSLGGVHKKVR